MEASYVLLAFVDIVYMLYAGLQSHNMQWKHIALSVHRARAPRLPLMTILENNTVPSP